MKLIYNGSPDNDGYCTNTTGIATTIGRFKFNENCDSPADVGYMYGTRYRSFGKEIPSVDENWIFGNDVEWDGSKYVLKDTVEIDIKNWQRTKGPISYKHYSCFSTENSCTEVGYIHAIDSNSANNTVYYIELTDGKTIEDAKEEMFSNKNDSSGKIAIDKWYRENLLGYEEKLEDTVWCNDRRIDGGSLKGKDYNLFDSRYRVVFQPESRKAGPKIELECVNEKDWLTVDEKNGSGTLTYPVALLTIDEMKLAGTKPGIRNKEYYLHNALDGWLLSPAQVVENRSSVTHHTPEGLLQTFSSTAEIFVRPSISFLPSIEIQSGNGSSTNPYIVD